MEQDERFAVGLPDWVRELSGDDFEVVATIYLSSAIGGDTMTEESLTQRVKNLEPDWSDEKVAAVVKVMVDNLKG